MISKKLKFIYLFYLIISSGLALNFYSSVYNDIILFAISFLYLVANSSQIKFNNLASAITIYVIYVGLSYLKFPGNNLFWPFQYIIRFTIVFTIVLIFKFEFFIIFEKIIYFLTITSLIFYTWQVFNIESLTHLLKYMNLNNNQNLSSNHIYINTIIYTINHLQYESNITLPRNSGFCWEPGPFACYVTLAMFIAILYKENRNVIIYKKYLIYILALVTTQSTTGFIVLFIMTIWVIITKIDNQITKLSIGLLSLLLMVILFKHLTFLGEKIDSQINTNLNQAVIEATSSEYSSNLDRFSSLKINLIELYNNPILGIGPNSKVSYSSKHGLIVNSTSGLGNLISKYGIIMFLLYLVALFQSSNLLTNHKQSKGRIFFILIFIVYGFSFNLLETPIFLTIVMYSYFLKDNYSVRSIT